MAIGTGEAVGNSGYILLSTGFRKIELEILLLLLGLPTQEVVEKLSSKAAIQI
jgi:hypothetical protein